MRRIALGCAAFLLASLSALGAQQSKPTTATSSKPDFTGRWVQLLPGLGAGGERVVQHSDTTLTVAEDSSHGSRLVYNLDGTESKNSFFSHGTDIVTMSKAEWKEGRLTISSVTNYPNGNRLEQLFVWSIDQKGQLIVDLTQQVTGRPLESTHIVYRRK